MKEQSTITPNKIHRKILLLLIAIGLIILGFAGFKLISDHRTTWEGTVIPVAVNYPAPELTLTDLQGNPVSIADFRNQILLVNNWAIWCLLCKEEMPTLDRYFKEHNEQGFMLLAINAGDPIDQVDNFVNDYGLSFPVLLDPNKLSMNVFHNDNLPSSYVIDRMGNIVLAWIGPINHAMLEKFVTPLLEQ